MIFRRPIGVGIILLWLGALVPELLPALVFPSPPNPLVSTGIFMFWFINYLLAATIFLVMPAFGTWLLVAEPVEPAESLQ